MKLTKILNELGYFGMISIITTAGIYSANKIHPIKDSLKVDTIESIVMPLLPDYLLYEMGKKPEDISKYHIALSIGMFGGQLLSEII